MPQDNLDQIIDQLEKAQDKMMGLNQAIALVKESIASLPINEVQLFTKALSQLEAEATKVQANLPKAPTTPPSGSTSASPDISPLLKELIDATKANKPTPAKGTPENPIPLKDKDLVKPNQSPPSGNGGEGGGSAAAIAGVAGAALMAGKALLSLPDTIGQLAAPFQRLVEAFNPAAALALTNALNDLQAAFGSVVEPVVAAFRAVADQINSLVTELAPILRPVVQDITDILKDLAGMLLGTFRPVIEAVIPVFQNIVEQIRPLFQEIGPLLTQLIPVITELVVSQFRPLQLILSILVPVFRRLLPIVTLIVQVMNEIDASFRELFNTLLEVIQPIVSSIFPIFESALNGLTNVMSTVVASMGAFAATIRYMANTLYTPFAWSMENFRRVFDENFHRLRAPQANSPRAPNGRRTQAASRASYIDTVEIGRQARLNALNIRSETDRNTEETRRNTEALERNTNSQGQGGGGWLFRSMREAMNRRSEVTTDFVSTGVGGTW